MIRSVQKRRAERLSLVLPLYQGITDEELAQGLTIAPSSLAGFQTLDAGGIDSIMRALQQCLLLQGPCPQPLWDDIGYQLGWLTDLRKDMIVGDVVAP